eukprot:7319636-Prymnesium_polylepis.1
MCLRESADLRPPSLLRDSDRKSVCESMFTISFAGERYAAKPKDRAGKRAGSWRCWCDPSTLALRPCT